MLKYHLEISIVSEFGHSKSFPLPGTDFVAVDEHYNKFISMIKKNSKKSKFKSMQLMVRHYLGKYYSWKANAADELSQQVACEWILCHFQIYLLAFRFIIFSFVFTVDYSRDDSTVLPLASLAGKQTLSEF